MNYKAEIDKVFKAFNVDAKVVEVVSNTNMTVCKVKLSGNTKAHKIQSVVEEMALALKSPIPTLELLLEEGLVALQFPNKVEQIITVEDLGKIPKGELPIRLGRDIKGRVVSIDLAEIPHLLMAGTTGSGKSNIMKVIIQELMATKTLDDIEFILIDPKQVELTQYAILTDPGMGGVVCDVESIIEILQKVVNVMNERYSQLNLSDVTNITDYNKIKGNKMKHIVICIDELADIILFDETKQIEQLICQIAQKARAAGIHLIIATQRPSVEVLTGLIKANMPVRLAFKTTSSLDSRIILDASGAEKLLGKGEALYKDIKGSTIRLQTVLAGDIRFRTEHNKTVWQSRYKAYLKRIYDEQMQTKFNKTEDSDAHNEQRT